MADDGINFAFGLQLTANQMKKSTSISMILSIILYFIFYLLYVHHRDINILPKLCLKYFKQAPFYIPSMLYNFKIVYIKDLEFYKDDSQEEEVEIVECTHL